MGKTTIVEIGVQVTEAQLKGLRAFLGIRGIPFYVEPPCDPPYEDLDALTRRCEGE